MKCIISLIALTLFLIAAPFTTSVMAHGIEETLEQVVQNYTLTLGYDALELGEGVGTPISFNIVDNDNDEPIMSDTA